MTIKNKNIGLALLLMSLASLLVARTWNLSKNLPTLDGIPLHSSKSVILKGLGPPDRRVSESKSGVRMDESWIYSGQNRDVIYFYKDTVTGVEGQVFQLGSLRVQSGTAWEQSKSELTKSLGSPLQMETGEIVFQNDTIYLRVFLRDEVIDHLELRSNN